MKWTGRELRKDLVGYRDCEMVRETDRQTDIGQKSVRVKVNYFQLPTFSVVLLDLVNNYPAILTMHVDHP